MAPLGGAIFRLWIEVLLSGFNSSSVGNQIHQAGVAQCIDGREVAVRDPLFPIELSNVVVHFAEA